MVKRIVLLSGLFVLVALIPLAVFGLSMIRMVSDHLVQRTSKELERDVQIDTSRTRQIIDMAQGDIAILSRVAAMQELIRAVARRDSVEIERWRKALEQVFLTFSTNRKVYHQIRYLDERGREFVRVNADGVNPPQIVPREGLQDKQQLDYFQETMKLAAGHVYISPLDLNWEDGRIEVPHRPVIRYAKPLFDDAGQRRGIVIINLMMHPILDALAQEAKAAQKVVYAVDQEGFYALHPDPAKQWGGPRDLNTGIRLHQDLPDLATSILSQQAAVTVAGEQVIASQALPLGPTRSGSSLVIVELMPTSIALAAVADVRLYLLIVLLGVGISAVAGAVVLGNRLTRPLASLADAVQQIQQGNLDVRVQGGGTREIAALGDAFNGMADSLVQSRGQIERHLAELSTLHRIGTSISGTLALTEVLDQALDATLHALGVQAAEIFLTDDTQAEVVLVQYRGPAPEAFREITRFKLGQGFPGQVALSGEPLITTNLAEDARFLRRRVIEAGFRTYAAIPLKAAGKIIGTLGVADRNSPAVIERDLSLLTTIGATIGVAVARAYLYEDLSHATQRLEAKMEELEQMQSHLVETERLRAMGQMAAGVAHDFNNALMGILGQTHLMRSIVEQGTAAAAAEGYAALVQCLTRQEQAVLDAATTVRKIRESTRQREIEALRPVELADIIGQALAITRPRWKDQAEAMGVVLTVHTDLAETPPALGNAAELCEALINLILNACDAMPQGGTVTIATRQVNDQAVELTVTDTGVGMSEAVQARIFEPFFTTKGVRGTGLGLSMVRGIIQRHEGEITAQSAEGQGTTMIVRLPVADNGVPEAAPAPAAPPPISRPLKILAIDDDPRLTETLADLLRILGHDSVIATNGREGLLLLEVERFDLVMTDIGMPGMSGWEVAQAVKAGWPTLPVILVTGWDATLTEEGIEDRGVDAVLAKPYTVAQLRNTLAYCTSSANDTAPKTA